MSSPPVRIGRSSPEVSRVGVVVVVDVRYDFGEPDDAGFLREIWDSSGHAEGRLLLSSDGPADTREKLK